MTSSPTWLNVSHGIISHTWLIVSHFFKWTTWLLPSVTLLGCHVASPNHTMCHPTPHASKNVKFRLPRNPMKFDVVARFREMISTEKSVSSSEIRKNSGYSTEITILPFIQKFGFSEVSHTVLQTMLQTSLLRI